MSNAMEVDSEGRSFPIVMNARVLVFKRHAGYIRYVPKQADELIGVELDRARGDCDGAWDGKRYFTCQYLHGIFVQAENLTPFSRSDEAACVIQSAWRKFSAIRKFRTIVSSHSWNMLDNNEEQLNLKRSAKFKSAEKTLQLLSNKKIDRSASEIVLDEIKIEDTYTGPHLEFPLTFPQVLNMLEAFRHGEILHFKYVMSVLKNSISILSPLPTLQEIHLEAGEHITVVGDLHGQLQDLFTIFSINGLPSKTNKYLFNGDFVDRGLYGTEVVMSILTFLLLYPDSVFLNRGNHESRNQNSWMGFEDEIWQKYPAPIVGHPPPGELERPVACFEKFQHLFDVIPLCAVLQKKIFVCHGGLFSRDGVTLAHLKAITRKREPPLHQTGYEDKIFEDMLWSDPRSIQSRQPSERGAGVEFGVSVTNNFCLVNKIALVIRSHECVQEGFEILHGGRLITLFSASRYCGTQMNKGAFLTLGPELQPEIQQFYAHVLTDSPFKESIAPDEKVPAPSKTMDSKEEMLERQDTLEDDTIRMIAERICDHKASLFWYFTQHQQERNGFIPRLTWAEALRSVLQLDLPFLTYQAKLADIDEETGLINYSQFLTRYRIENEVVDAQAWQEKVIANICSKLYRAMGAGDMKQAFHIFDTDDNGFIEYQEFTNTLKRLDTGLSDQQVFELMRTADTNDDGRIDFAEFVQRFEVIFTDLRHNADKENAGVALTRPGLTTSDGSSHSSPSTSFSKKRSMRSLLRRTSDLDAAANRLAPGPSVHLDVETMEMVLRIGKALFALGGSLYDHFNRFDVNQDGVLHRDEFEQATRSLGFDMSPSLLTKLMTVVDTDGGNSIDYKEFLTAFTITDNKSQDTKQMGNLTWQQSVLQQVSNVFYQHRIHIRNAFRMFDTSNTGTITLDEFRVGIMTFNSVLDSPLTDDQIEALLEHLDSDRDGVISYREFFDGFRVVDIRITDEE